MRRVWAVSLLMLFSLPVLGDGPAATIRFLSQSEAREALTTGAERRYYARLQLPEMRAKTGLALQNMTLEAAREQVREAYGARAEEFSADEQAALRDIVTALQPSLRTRAPLYARTPWVFIKVDATIEGGLPHTRGENIVLSDALLARVVQVRAKGASGAPVSLWNLLVHEQTHVLQRHHPELFANLYTQSLGFRQVALAPAPPWLIERNVVNPDAPRSLPAAFQDLSALPDFARAFPLQDELFHPNEISAGLLAAIITGSGIEHPEHPLWNKTRAWADQALR
jgi:hypothetical protein